MAGKVEMERKYETPDDFELPDLTTVPGVDSAGEPETMNLDAVYYDCADLRLARRGVTVRRRRGGHDAGWHIKRPAGAYRTESQFPPTGSTKVPEAVATELRALTRGTPLVQVARIHTTRRETSLRDTEGTVLAQIAQDDVQAQRLLDPPAERRWRELEVEIVAGEPDLLDKIGDVLAAAGVRPASSASKLAQAVGDDANRDKPDDNDATPAGAALTGYLREQRDALLGNDPLARAGDVDGVHDMRVATRRLRSTLSTFRRHLGDTEALRGELKWLADLLGAVRDRDVLGDLILADAADDLVRDRVRRHLESNQDTARHELAAGLDSARYFALLDAVDALVDRPAAPIAAGALLDRTQNRLMKAGRMLEDADGDDVALHEARKAYKKARYAVEAVHVLDGQAAQRLVKRLKAMQDALGQHQDAVIAAALVEEIGGEAHRDGENAFPYGQLHARMRARAQAERQRLDRLYRRTTQSKVRSWLIQR
jgi:CHAD domain-containing protein